MNQFQLFDLDNKHIIHSDNMLHSLGRTMVHLKSAYLRSAHINREEKQRLQALQKHRYCTLKAPHTYLVIVMLGRAAAVTVSRRRGRHLFATSLLSAHCSLVSVETAATEITAEPRLTFEGHATTVRTAEKGSNELMSEQHKGCTCFKEKNHSMQDGEESLTHCVSD